MSDSSRLKKQNQPKKTSFKRMITMLILFFTIVVAGISLGFLGATLQTLPSVEDVKPAATSQIYDVRGNLITSVHSEENRLPIHLGDMPKNLQNAFVAAEDVRFYNHHGVDPRGILRALWVNITHQGVAEGGSTITQQLARNAFLTQDRTLKRKIKEVLLAFKIEQTYTKPEILEMYINQIYFGQGAYGVQTAAQTYFGVDAKNLTLGQAAMLAGVPNSPNYLNPFNNLEAAKARQATVLDQMAKYGYITEAQAKEAKEAPLHLQSKAKASKTNPIFSYFTDYVVQEVAEKYGDDAVYKGGLKIYTTLDMDAQKAAVEAMHNLPTYYSDEKGVQQPQGALVAINPHNGYIVAMVGGRGTDYFNRAVLAQRQPGSAFKPFVYLAALQEGMTPGSIIDDKKIDYGEWSPQNYERKFYGQITMRWALQHSVNGATVQIADKVGMPKIIALAEKMGISTLVKKGYPNDENLAVSLGGLTHGTTPLDMASAYSVLANGGKRITPVAITKIVDRNGQILEENTLEEKRVISEKDAYVLTNMLQSVVNGGTGTGANYGRPIAGKTGTTDDSKDAWFVGYSPNLSTAVWIGDDYGVETLNGITGGSLPATIWREFMSSTQASGSGNFTVPDGVQSLISQGYQNPAPPEDKNKDKDKDKDKDKNKDKDKTTDKKEADKKTNSKTTPTDSKDNDDQSTPLVKGGTKQ